MLVQRRFDLRNYIAVLDRADWIDRGPVAEDAERASGCGFENALRAEIGQQAKSYLDVANSGFAGNLVEQVLDGPEGVAAADTPRAGDRNTQILADLVRVSRRFRRLSRRSTRPDKVVRDPNTPGLPVCLTKLGDAPVDCQQVQSKPTLRGLSRAVHFQARILWEEISWH